MIKWRISLLAVLALMPCPASAETLRDAILSAYATNPALAEARAREEARAEGVEQERARGRSTVAADGELGTIGSANLVAALPVWTGGLPRCTTDAGAQPKRPHGSRGRAAAGQRTVGPEQLSVKVRGALTRQTDAPDGMDSVFQPQPFMLANQTKRVSGQLRRPEMDR